MFGITHHTRVFIRTRATDGRLGFEEPKAIIAKVIREDPLAGGQLFVFANRARNRMRLPWWDGSGLFLATKRIRTGHFEFPKNEGAVMKMTLHQLEPLLKGVNFVRRPSHR